MNGHAPAAQKTQENFAVTAENRRPRQSGYVIAAQKIQESSAVTVGNRRLPRNGHAPAVQITQENSAVTAALHAFKQEEFYGVDQLQMSEL